MSQKTLGDKYELFKFKGIGVYRAPVTTQINHGRSAIPEWTFCTYRQVRKALLQITQDRLDRIFHTQVSLYSLRHFRP